MKDCEHSERRILSVSKTMDITNLSRTTLWRLENAGQFPKRKQITPRRVGYDSREVYEWMDSREAVR
jgi:predicted DNA-binding transcriptional regulator AlpA